MVYDPESDPEYVRLKKQIEDAKLVIKEYIDKLKSDEESE